MCATAGIGIDLEIGSQEVSGKLNVLTPSEFSWTRISEKCSPGSLEDVLLADHIAQRLEKELLSRVLTRRALTIWHLDCGIRVKRPFRKLGRRVCFIDCIVHHQMMSGGDSRKVLIVICSNHPRKLADTLRTVRATGTQKEFNIYLNPKAPSGVRTGRGLCVFLCCYELLV